MGRVAYSSGKGIWVYQIGEKDPSELAGRILCSKMGFFRAEQKTGIKNKKLKRKKDWNDLLG